MRIFKYLLGLFVVAGLIVSCTDDDLTVLDGTATAPVLNSSAGMSIVLHKDSAQAEATTFTWNALTLSVNTPVSYIFEVAAGGTSFADPKVLQVSADTSLTMTVEQLNSRAVAMGIEPEKQGTLDFRVTARIGSGNSLDYVSAPITLEVTTYRDQIDLSTTWGIVGSATPNGWNGPDIPLWKTGTDNVYVAYATLTDGEIKFRENNSWELDYGGTNGTLVKKGPNIAVTAGKYKILVNFNDLTYSIEKFSLGIVGSATPNGWSGPDVVMNFDSSSGKFRAVTTLGDGEIKFRLNNDFGTNWGGSNGTLSAGGDNIAVAAGTYVVTVDLKELTYKLEPLANVWGLVGSATPNGWNGPDIQLKIDYTSDYAAGAGIWYIDNVHLTAGELKFRANNAWDLDYGDDGANGTLEAGGANIAIGSSGNYDVVLNLSDLTYSITPH